MSWDITVTVLNSILTWYSGVWSFDKYLCALIHVLRWVRYRLNSTTGRNQGARFHFVAAAMDLRVWTCDGAETLWCVPVPLECTITRLGSCDMKLSTTIKWNIMSDIVLMFVYSAGGESCACDFVTCGMHDVQHTNAHSSLHRKLVSIHFLTICILALQTVTHACAHTRPHWMTHSHTLSALQPSSTRNEYQLWKYISPGIRAVPKLVFAARENDIRSSVCHCVNSNHYVSHLFRACMNATTKKNRFWDCELPKNNFCSPVP